MLPTQRERRSRHAHVLAQVAALDHRDAECVYLLRATRVLSDAHGRRDLVKIGYSSAGRLATRVYFHAGHVEGGDATLLAAVPGGPFDEHFLHGVFAPQRIRNEWFHATPALLAVAAALAREGAPLLARMRAAAVAIALGTKE